MNPARALLGIGAAALSYGAFSYLNGYDKYKGYTQDANLEGADKKVISKDKTEKEFYTSLAQKAKAEGQLHALGGSFYSLITGVVATVLAVKAQQKKTALAGVVVATSGFLGIVGSILFSYKNMDRLFPGNDTTSGTKRRIERDLNTELLKKLQTKDSDLSQLDNMSQVNQTEKE